MPCRLDKPQDQQAHLNREEETEGQQGPDPAIRAHQLPHDVYVAFFFPVQERPERTNGVVGVIPVGGRNARSQFPVLEEETRDDTYGEQHS